LSQHYGSCLPGCAGSFVVPTDQHCLCPSPMIRLLQVVRGRRDANRPAPALPQHYGSCPLGCAGSVVMPTDQHSLCPSPMIRLLQVVRGRRDANRPAPTLSQHYGSCPRFVSSRLFGVGVMPTDQHPLSLSAMVPLFQVVPCRRDANRPALALRQLCAAGRRGANRLPASRTVMHTSRIC